MSLFYVLGGPREGEREAFFRRLEEVGGTPPGWTVYPHAAGDGQALHLVDAASSADVLAHLDALGAIYAHGPVVEIVPLPPHPPRD